MDDRNQSKLRLCLICRQYFQSNSAGNRYCPSCKKQKPKLDPNYHPVEFTSYYSHKEVSIIKQSIDHHSAKRRTIKEKSIED